MSLRKLLKKFDVFGDLAMGGRGYLVSGTRITNEIGQHGRHENSHIRQGGQGAGEYVLLGTVDYLVGTTEGRYRALERAKI